MAKSTEKNANRISPKQRAFIERYLVSMNASQAARECGYSKMTGSRLMHNPVILAEIDRRLGDLTMRANEVIARLTMHARGSMADFLEVSDDGEVKLNLGKGNCALLKRVKLDRHNNPIDVELYDAQSALAQLGKYHELFTDRLRVDATLTGQVQIYIPDNGRTQTADRATGSVPIDSR